MHFIYTMSTIQLFFFLGVPKKLKYLQISFIFTSTSNFLGKFFILAGAPAFRITTQQTPFLLQYSISSAYFGSSA